jgi:hypothetical protein
MQPPFGGLDSHLFRDAGIKHTPVLDGRQPRGEATRSRPYLPGVYVISRLHNLSTKPRPAADSLVGHTGRRAPTSIGWRRSSQPARWDGSRNLMLGARLVSLESS